MSLPEKEIVQQTLKPYESYLRDIVIGGWQAWLGSSIFPTIRYARTRANIVWDLMIGRALEGFAQEDGIQMVKGHETMSFIVDDQVMIRFKKGDASGLSCNIPTQTALAYNDHLGCDDLLFPEMAPTRVEVVYTLDRKTQMSIDKIFIVAREGNTILWAYDIMEKQPQVFEFHILPADIQRTPPKELVALSADETLEEEGMPKT